jgi:hypothetical protein
MGKLLKRWYLWLGLLLLLGLAGSVALISSSRSRLTQANFDRIQKGVTLPEVVAIVGHGSFTELVTSDTMVLYMSWRDGRAGAG